MGHRTYTDASGHMWSVWDVTPQWTERRSRGDRRRAEDGSVVDPPAVERRRAPDRRAGTDATSRVRISEGLSRGWLAFESGSDRRRFAPIPAGWESLPDVELEALCARAVAAPALRRPTE